MPILVNPRHERFVQLLWAADSKGYSQALCYVTAGYRASLKYPAKGKACAASVNASRLLRKANVKERLLEIMAMANKRHEITQDSLIAELEEARLSALANAQSGAAVQATMGKAKITGHIIERKESGKPGDFDNMTTEELKAYIEGMQSPKAPTHDGSDNLQ